MSDSDYSTPLENDSPTSRSEPEPSEAPTEPSAGQAAAEPAPLQPAPQGGAPGQPAREQAASEQAASEQAASEQPASEQPASEQPASEQPASEEPTSEQPAREQSSQPRQGTSDRDQASAPSVPRTDPAPTPPPLQATAPTDLLDADPSAMWYVRPPSGGQYGPATGRLLKEWIGEGRVAAASLLWREDWAQWRRADEVLPHLVSDGQTPLAGPPSGPAEPSTAVERPLSGSHPHAGGYPTDRSSEPAAAQTPPPGRVRRQRKIRRMTTIGVLAGLSVLLLIILIVVLIGGLGS